MLMEVSNQFIGVKMEVLIYSLVVPTYIKTKYKSVCVSQIISYLNRDVKVYPRGH